MAIFQDFAIFPLVKDKLNNVTNFSGTIMKASRNISLEICSILDDLFIFISLHQIINYVKDKIGVVFLRSCVIFDTL